MNVLFLGQLRFSLSMSYLCLIMLMDPSILKLLLDLSGVVGAKHPSAYSRGI